jgi:hypothetical protein
VDLLPARFEVQKERCALCGCRLIRRAGVYAQPTIEGRSHATDHHYVAERFFGRSANRPGNQRVPIFDPCPWGVEGLKETFCYECHEEVIHNPVLVAADVRALSDLVRHRGLSEQDKAESREKLAGRIKLFHEVIQAGLESLLEKSAAGVQPSSTA